MNIGALGAQVSPGPTTALMRIVVKLKVKPNSQVIKIVL